MTSQPKGSNLRKLRAEHSFRNPIYIGDTIGDYRAAREAEYSFIHVKYGFGVAPDAEVVAENFKEVVDLIHRT